jgi:hypothetical protein
VEGARRPALPVPRRRGGHVGLRRGARRPDRARAAAPVGPLRRAHRCAGQRGRARARPRPSAPVPAHAARAQTDVAAVGGLVDPRAVRHPLRAGRGVGAHRDRPGGGPRRRDRRRRARARDDHVHRGPARRHGRARMARSPPRAAVRLRGQRPRRGRRHRARGHGRRAPGPPHSRGRGGARTGRHRGVGASRLVRAHRVHQRSTRTAADAGAGRDPGRGGRRHGRWPGARAAWSAALPHRRRAAQRRRGRHPVRDLRGGNRATPPTPCNPNARGWKPGGTGYPWA